MDLKQHTHPDKLEYYSFIWSELRLVLSAVTLILAALSGSAIPLAVKLTGAYSLSSISSLFWLISGVASAYLLYLWVKGGKKVFGGNDKKDMAAFFISVIFGLNLGLAGIGSNIALGIANNFSGVLLKIVFLIGALVYVWTAWHLWSRWNASGKSLFSGSSAPSAPTPPPSPSSAPDEQNPGQ